MHFDETETASSDHHKKSVDFEYIDLKPRRWSAWTWNVKSVILWTMLKMRSSMKMQVQLIYSALLYDQVDRGILSHLNPLPFNI